MTTHRPDPVRLLLYLHRNPLRAKIVERLADYPWSSYRALAYGRGGPAWFDRRLMYEQFGLDAKGFRQAVRRYDEGRDDLLSSLYYGLVLGSSAVVEELRKRLEGRRDREKPQLQALRSHGSLEERLAEYGRRPGAVLQVLVCWGLADTMGAQEELCGEKSDFVVDGGKMRMHSACHAVYG